MRRPFGCRTTTCESCISIDVRRWHREGKLCPGLSFSCSWTCGGEPSGSIKVRTEVDTLVLIYSARSWRDIEWKSVQQRVPMTWTACHLGGRRPWFVCPGCSDRQYCGRRVALLYGKGELFACRHCYGLTYACQREASYRRDFSKAQKIRMRLGGSPDSEEFPDKPKGMHWRTYDRLYHLHEAAEERSIIGLMNFVGLSGGRTSRRA
jgi:hypothetical protein